MKDNTYHNFYGYGNFLFLLDKMKIDKVEFIN